MFNEEKKPIEQIRYTKKSCIHLRRQPIFGTDKTVCIDCGAISTPQQTNGARAKATLPPDCLECAFSLCCDRGHPVADGSCFEQRR